ncbi:MAG: tyrosine-type recombinase/integrase [Sediminibacterium sp.]
MHRYTCKIIQRIDIPRKDGTCLLSLQAFINKKRIVIPLSLYASPAEWDDQQQKIIFKKKSLLSKKEVDDYNLILANSKAKASDIFVHHRLTDDDLTADRFKKLFLEEESRHDFIAFMRKEIEKQKGLKHVRTITAYNNTLFKIQNFAGNVPFRKLSFEFISDFDRWMTVKEKLHLNTRWKQHKNIKFFINQAIRKGFNIESPYVHFKTKQARTNRTFLTPEEVHQLKEIYFDERRSGTFKKVLQYFLFSCFTGLRVSDVKQLTEEMIVENELIIKPQKSIRIQKQLRIPLSANAKSFLVSNLGTIFSPISEKHLNDTLKAIARAVDPEIKKKVTMHVARHTFAMMFLEAGGKVERLQQILGHSKIETTMVYVHIREESKRIDIDKMDDLMARL